MDDIESQASAPLSVSPLDTEAPYPVPTRLNTHDDPYPQGVFDRNGVIPPYAKMAESQVKSTIEVLDSQLNILLTFSALFSAAISGLLSLSWSLMNANSADQTNYLLRQLVHSADPSTQPAPEPLSVFSPSSDAVIVNTLISVSLTCSLLASFGAVLAKQWLVYFARTSKPFAHDQDQEYQKLLDGAKNWYLRSIVELALPMLLQASLIMFIMGLIKFVHVSSPKVAMVNYIFAVIALSAFGLSILLAVWDPYCPYQTALSRSMFPTFSKALGFTTWFIIGIMLIALIAIVLPLEMTARGIIQGLKDRDVRSIPGRLYKLWGQGFQSFKSNLRHLLYEYPKMYGNMFQSIMANWHRPSPNDAVNYGSAAAWMFETATDIVLLRSVLASIIEIKNFDFLRAFVERGGWLEVQKALEGTKTRLKAKKERPSPLPDAGTSLFEMDAVILRDVILHLYVGTEEPNTPETMNAWEALTVHLLRYEGYNPTTRQAELCETAGSHPLSIAASIKILIHARSYRWTVGQIFLFPTDAMKQELQAAVRHCLVPVLPSTPPLGVSLIALAAGIIPCRPVVAIGDVETDLVLQRKDDVKLIRASYADPSFLLRNTALAVKTYCSLPGGLSQERLCHSSESIHISLLDRVTILIISGECAIMDIEKDSHALIDEIGRLLLLNATAIPFSDPREIEMVQLKGTQLVAALLVRLQPDERDSQHQVNQSWTPVDFQTFEKCIAWLSHNNLLDERTISAFQSLEESARRLPPDPATISFLRQIEMLAQSGDALPTPDTEAENEIADDTASTP